MYDYCQVWVTFFKIVGFELQSFIVYTKTLTLLVLVCYERIVNSTVSLLLIENLARSPIGHVLNEQGTGYEHIFSCYEHSLLIELKMGHVI